MEIIDPQKANRVWQRVQGGQQTDPETLIPLVAMAVGEGAAYLQLARRFFGNQTEALRQLSRRAYSNAACLRGMYQMRTGNALPMPANQDPLGENIQAALRRCYGRKLQNIAAYEERKQDPEYGFVFAQLAQQEKEACQALLTLLGNLKF